MGTLGGRDLHPPDLWIDTGRCHIEMASLDEGDDLPSEMTRLRTTSSPDGSTS